MISCRLTAESGFCGRILGAVSGLLSPVRCLYRPSLRPCLCRSRVSFRIGGMLLGVLCEPDSLLSLRLHLPRIVTHFLTSFHNTLVCGILLLEALIERAPPQRVYRLIHGLVALLERLVR